MSANKVSNPIHNVRTKKRGLRIFLTPDPPQTFVVFGKSRHPLCPCMIVPKNASNKMLFQKCDKEKMVKNQKISAAPIGTGECRGG